MTRQFIRSFLIAFITMCSIPALCQESATIHYTINDGLPSNTVYYIYRSSRGFLWLATDKGVARYDGIKFEKFTTFDGLTDNEIFFFKEDLEGRLWLATYNGELCFYKDGIFHNPSNTPYLKLPVKTSFTREIQLEKDSSVSLFFYDYILVNIKNDKCTIIDLKKIPAEPLNMHFSDFTKISDNLYQERTAHSVVLFDTLANIVKKSSADNSFMKDFYRKTFIQDQTYLLSGSSIYDLSLKRIKTIKKSILENYIYQIYISAPDTFVITSTGLFLNDSIQFLKNYKVSCLNQDINGNYWASTLGNGLFLINRHFNNATVYKNAYSGEIEYLKCYKKELFFTTSDNTLSRFSNGRTEKILNFDYLLRKENAPDNPGFYIDSNYRFYVCYFYQTLIIDGIRNKALQIKKYRNELYAHSSIKKIKVANEDVYIDSRSKIFKVNIAEKKNMANQKIVTDTAHPERIFDMEMDEYNNIWYSTASHIYKIENDRPVIQPQFKNILLKSFEFFGKYLIGYTFSNQLVLCKNTGRDDLSIDFIPPQNCIWDNLYEVDSSHFLISTNNLYRLLTIQPGNIDKKYSIAAIENPFIPQKAEAIISDGNRCYFFKDGSITYVPVSELLVKPDAPKLFFRSLKTGRATKPVQSDMELHFDEAKNISISFSVLSFRGKDVSYQYSISKNGVNNWRDFNGTELNLINSNYGNYSVQIRAKTISSAFSAPISFNLNILKPFWLTWWFITLCAAGILAAAGLFIRMRTLSLLRKKEKEHNIQLKFLKSEYKALNALMNPHFIFNTLNNVQGLVNRNDKLAANEYLRVFADLIRQNMHNISKELIPLQKEINLVTNYLLLEKLRFKQKLNYAIEIDENLDLSDILIPPLLVQPLVENSIKHGILPLESEDGFVNIKVYQHGDKLFIEVKDNGVGLEKAEQQSKLHDSMGLQNVRKRLEQLSIIQNKKIELNITEIKGTDSMRRWTVVTIVTPITE
jgi:two-component sensor histidine kinase